MSIVNLKKSLLALKVNLFFGFLTALPFALFLILYVLPKVETDVYDARKKLLSASIDNAYSLVNANYQKYKNGLITESEAKKLAKREINSLRYLGSEYFWINDKNAKIILHPIKPNLNGKDLSKFQDPNGKYIFKEFAEVAQSKGQGFVKYHWPKVESDNPVPKISLVKFFPEWGWVIGTGVYVDDLNMVISTETSLLIKAIVITTILSIIFSLWSGFWQLNHTIIPVKKSLKSLIHVVESLSGSSTQMKSIGDSLSNYAQDQATQIHQTASSVEEIKRTVEYSHQNAFKSSDISQESRFEVERGKKTINEMAQEVQKIEENYRSIMTEVEKSGKEFQKIIDMITEIEDKTTVINDIVFQTKLLSFNASVEAARAGEHGKGFAVVAEEVGGLAGMSGNASHEIAEILTESVKNVKTIVNDTNLRVKNLIENGKHNLDIGLKSVKESQESFEKIFSNVSNTDDMIRGIVEASQEQKQGISEINFAVRELDRITHENLSMAKSSSSMSDSIYDDVQKVEQVVERLKKAV